MYPGEFKDVLSLIKSSSIYQGPFTEQFEQEFKQYVEVKEAIAVSSGRCALKLILKKLGLKRGDGIILSSYNFQGVPMSLLKEGFRLQFVDAHRDTYQMDVERVEEKIDSNTKAIIATHLFGQPCDLDRIIEIAKKYNLFVIEDAAHSLGSRYRDRFTGAIADAGFFSFTGSKTLNTSFGGMVVTNNIDLANKIRNEIAYYSYPRRAELIKEIVKRYIYIALANRIFYTLIEYPLTLLMSLFKYDPLEVYKSLKKSEIAERHMKFTNFQALLGVKQINFAKKLIQKRRNIANFLIKNLKPSISIQKILPDSLPNYFMFPIRTKDKMKVFKSLLLRGIDSNLNYALDCSYLVENCHTPIAKYLSETILTINLPFDLSKKEVFYLAHILNKVMG